MHRVPEVEITRSLADPALRIKAFIDCANMLAWEAWIDGCWAKKATMVFAHISEAGDSVTWKFKFLNMATAEAFNKEFA